MLNRLKTFFVDYQMILGRSRLRSYLLTLSDRALKDLGFSRHLLKQGISSWPWRPSIAKILTFDQKVKIFDAYGMVNMREKEIKQAIAELKSYSDRELADLDIPRENIEFVVRNGRPRLDEDPRNLNMKKRQSIAA